MERSGISVRCSRLLEYSYPSLSIESQFAQCSQNSTQHPDSDTNHSYNYTKYSRDNPCHEITSYPPVSG